MGVLQYATSIGGALTFGWIGLSKWGIFGMIALGAGAAIGFFLLFGEKKD